MDGGGEGDTRQALPHFATSAPPCAWEHKSPKVWTRPWRTFPAFTIPSSIPPFRIRHEHLKGWGAKCQTSSSQTPAGSRHAASARPSPGRPAPCPRSPRRAHLAPLAPRRRPGTAAALRIESSGGGAALPGKHVGLEPGWGGAAAPGWGEAARDRRGSSGGFIASPRESFSSGKISDSIEAGR